MFGEHFLRDFFWMEQPANPQSLYDSFGRDVVEKALELAKGQLPESNLMPYINIVAAAKRLGLEVSRPAERTTDEP